MWAALSISFRQAISGGSLDYDKWDELITFGFELDCYNMWPYEISSCLYSESSLHAFLVSFEREGEKNSINMGLWGILIAILCI